MPHRLMIRWLRGVLGSIAAAGAMLTLAGVAQAQVTYDVVHAFARGARFPASALIQASDGNFYGTAQQGGANDEGGVVFRLTPDGVLTTLYSFNCAQGCSPQGNLVQAADGLLYGVLGGGGANNGGAVFKVTLTGTFTVLHSFICATDGCFPSAGLVEASDGTLYGTTQAGGPTDGGSVYTITTAGAFDTLHLFDCGTGGCFPQAGLIQTEDGTFYGTTAAGGEFSGGTVFTITDGVVSTLHSFDCNTEGCSPFANLLQATDGNFYGTTLSGGTSGAGTVFKITAAGTVTTLHSFDCSTEGCAPLASLVQASDGNFYGTTQGGGTSGAGTVFTMTPAGALTTLASLDCETAVGCFPVGLTLASDGTLYGTAETGGPGSGGSVFRITEEGELAAVHAFICSLGGCGPIASLIQASDGNFYGTTRQGGAFGRGTVFTITPSGALTTLHSFDCSTDGCDPQGALLESSGSFYGTTSVGPEFGGGTVFSITPAGALTTRHSFDCSTEGCLPAAGLILASDGKFYGTTFSGGALGRGTVFSITSDDAFATLHDFDCSTDGCQPAAGLIQAGSDFYGTTSFGGSLNRGTVFRITPSGVLTTLHSFDCDIGCQPRAGLIQASDGNLYGMTLQDISANEGTIFRITPTGGGFATLHTFDCPTDGCSPQSALVQGSDGNFYGTAAAAGPEGAGVIFRLSLGSAPILSALSPAKLWIGLKNSDAIGLRVDLLAEVFVDTTKVGQGQLNNVSAGGAGFNNAILDTIPIILGGPAPVPAGSALKIKLSVRRTCTGSGHNAGSVRLWYNGRAVDSGAARDAGSRFDTTIGETTANYFLRTGLALNTTAGTSKQSIDVAVDNKQSCPARTFKPFGTWSIVP